MDYTFVPQYNGEAPKKRRLAKACSPCRAKKKRCNHHPIEDDDENTDRNVRSSRHCNERYRGISVQKGNSNRFLSDLNPETRLLERTPADGEDGRAKSMDSVGIWVNRSEYDSLVQARNAAQDAGLFSNVDERSDTTKPISLDKAQLDGLVDVYFRRIHPLLPILEESDFRRAYIAGSVPEPLIHALCLVAAKDSEAVDLLRAGDGTHLLPRQLCKSLQASAKAAITGSLRHDKISLICLLALLSMHNESSDGAEEASLYLVQAMHHCQTLGLHLSASFPARDGKHTKRLFWCLWILDRFSAAMNGRPIMMADNDVAIEQFQPGESDFPGFEILLKITAILNGVIGYYRPGNPPSTTGWQEQYPGFEEIVECVSGWEVSSSMLSTLHVAYLSVSILSHRSKGTADFASTTPSYVRQSLAAIRIIRLMNPTRLPTLHALPMLPYAISLALSVSYQHLRQDQLAQQQEDARADFEACYVVLRELKKTWASADAMSVLSEKVVEELRRMPSITSFRIKRPANDEKALEGFTSACKHDGEPVAHTNGAVNRQHTEDRSMLAPDMQQLYTPAVTDKDRQLGNGLFEGIDDIFGTYLDPNYPVNLDFLDGIDSLDTEWMAT